MEQVHFTRAVERHQDMVYRVALHSLGTPQDADDAVREVFLRLYQRAEPFDSPEHLRRWLLRVTLNYCRDVLKSPWRRRRVSLESLPELPAFQREEERVLYQTVMSLPEKYRTVLDLFYYEELSVREIAGLLHIEVSAVTTRLSRARGKLKDALGEGWSDDE